MINPEFESQQMHSHILNTKSRRSAIHSQTKTKTNTQEHEQPKQTENNNTFLFPQYKTFFFKYFVSLFVYCSYCSCFLFLEFSTVHVLPAETRLTVYLRSQVPVQWETVQTMAGAKSHFFEITRRAYLVSDISL